MVVELIRLEESLEGTLGILKLNKELFCFTLEPPDHENERNKSSIPTGQYVCKRWDSTKYGSTWKVDGVYRRSGILIHPGNFVGHTSGCILVGSSIGKLKGDRAVLNSGATFKDLMERTAGPEELHLTVSEFY